MKNICIIMGAGPAQSTVPTPAAGDLIIAADGGLQELERRNIRWDLTLGDYDSLGFVPDRGEVIRHPVEKDETDMQLAVREAAARGYERFLLLGSLGGRLDHTLANMQELRRIAESGGRAFMAGEGQAITALAGGNTLTFPAGMQGTVSVFCAGDRAEGVTLQGLQYTLTDGILTGDTPTGVSNAFTGAPASITLRRGTLWVLWTESTESLAARLRND